MYHKHRKNIFFITIYSFLLVCLFGCQAFVRKFTRKPKNEDLSKEEMVLAPQEYNGPEISKEELYRQYFLYWKSWQDELIYSLNPGGNHKKQIDCVNEAIKNISRMKQLLALQKYEQAAAYESKLESLRASIGRDVYSNNTFDNRSKAEQLRRNILRDLSFNKVKNSLI